MAALRPSTEYSPACVNPSTSVSTLDMAARLLAVMVMPSNPTDTPLGRHWTPLPGSSRRRAGATPGHRVIDMLQPLPLRIGEGQQPPASSLCDLAMRDAILVEALHPVCERLSTRDSEGCSRDLARS
ncbi:MAG: hypothetical protein H0W02_15330 [Ktedonobacteraceae bacterium]|nr:hypothetical protein [Ktedonobacteraceae bacterium]